MSTEKTIHVVAFDVPFPPDYGGVTDIYFRCKTLKEAGYHIILHCFEYGRGRKHDFRVIADEVHYYTRSKRLLDWFSRKPFIVLTRQSDQLLERLSNDHFPIIFEGQHTTAFLAHPALRERKKLVRLHNIEWQYYDGLAQRTDSWTKRRYYRSESRKLRKHETILNAATTLACISHSDAEYYAKYFPSVVYMPVAFDTSLHTNKTSTAQPFFLFHGNLGVAENEEAAHWLVKAFSGVQHHLVLAGKDPSDKLKQECLNNSQTELIANPTAKELEELMCSATAHLLISFQHSGIKLKLLHALMTGKRCIVTPEMVAGTGLEQLCTVISDKSSLLRALELPEQDESAGMQQQNLIRNTFAPEKTIEVINKSLF